MDALIGHGDLCDYVKHARQIDGHLIFLSADNSFTILITPIIYMTFGWERCDTKCIKIPDVHKKLNGILIVQSIAAPSHRHIICIRIINISSYQILVYACIILLIATAVIIYNTINCTVRTCM